jgi:hypothetical protein
MNLFRKKQVNDAVDKTHGNVLKDENYFENQFDPESQKDRNLQSDSKLLNHPEPQGKRKEEIMPEKAVSKEEKQILFLRKLHLLSKELGATSKVTKAQSILWTSDDMSGHSEPMSSSSIISPTLRATTLKKANLRSPLIRNDACGEFVDVHSYSEDREAIDTTNYKVNTDPWEFRTESECLPGFVKTMFLQLGACNDGMFGQDVTSEEKIDALFIPHSDLNESPNHSSKPTIATTTVYEAEGTNIHPPKVLPREVSLSKSIKKEGSGHIASFKEDGLLDASNTVTTPKVQSQYPFSDTESSVFDSEWFTPEQPVRNRTGNIDLASMTSSISSRFSHRNQ